MELLLVTAPIIQPGRSSVGPGVWYCMPGLERRFIGNYEIVHSHRPQFSGSGRYNIWMITKRICLGAKDLAVAVLRYDRVNIHASPVGLFKRLGAVHETLALVAKFLPKLRDERIALSAGEAYFRASNYRAIRN